LYNHEVETVIDVWFNEVVKNHTKGAVQMIRYAVDSAMPHPFTKMRVVKSTSPPPIHLTAAIQKSLDDDSDDSDSLLACKLNF